MNRVIAAAFQAIASQSAISVKMSATRCLIKYLRRLPKDNLPSSDLIKAGLTPLLALMQSASIECV